jgi:putative transposase
MTDTAVSELAPVIGVRAACEAVGSARAGWYRRHRQSPPPRRPAPVPHRDRVQPRALSEAERQAILDELHCERFVDVSPTQVWAILLDEGRYLGSTSTFYRLLRDASGTRERRRQAMHPAAVKPELLATEPNAVWSWDITKLRGPTKWSWFHLYVILDIYSRYVVGWMVASRESAGLAEVLIRQTCAKQGIGPHQLTIHADRGSSMTSKPVAFLLADLGVTQSHSRPHVSDDNPFSEAQFKSWPPPVSRQHHGRTPTENPPAPRQQIAPALQPHGSARPSTPPDALPRHPTPCRDILCQVDDAEATPPDLSHQPEALYLDALGMTCRRPMPRSHATPT